MVAKASIEQRALIFLRAVRLMAIDLEEVASEWDTLDPAERASWSLDWDHAIADQLGELVDFERRGDLSEALLRQYHDLLRQLEASRPLIERLNLYRPETITMEEQR